MEDRQLCAKLLGFEFPWLISEAQVGMPAGRHRSDTAHGNVPGRDRGG